MRHPRRLVRDMGLGPCLVFQVLIAGLILSAILHPLMIVTIAVALWTLFGGQTIGPVGAVVLSVDIINIFGSYAVFIALGRSAMTFAERQRIGPRWIYTPVYWLLISYAAWRALYELMINPFYWNKTEHRPATTSAPSKVDS